MSFTNYLFSFQGRINRAKLWLFILIGIAWEIVIVTVMMASFGAASVSDLALGHATPSALTLGMTGMIAAAAVVLLFLAYLYAAVAVTVKRLHDRNKGAAWLLVFWVLPIGLEIAGIAVAGVGVATAAHDQAPQMSLIVLPFVAAAVGVAIWAFVELYCLRGTAGDNRFGADPLAGKA
ncbi:MAG: DUF805 domain-containing protein [Alphaproteobacteria bacterium]|nr:DUF805 domain-containing protein [Alphaproteobacteria bacterium]